MDSIQIMVENKGKTASELATFLSPIAACRGLRLYWLSPVDRLHATVHMSQTGLDFQDSTTLEAYLGLSVDDIISFDKDFDGLPSTKRPEPKDLLPSKQ